MHSAARHVHMASEFWESKVNVTHPEGCLHCAGLRLNALVTEWPIWSAGGFFKDRGRSPQRSLVLTGRCGHGHSGRAVTRCYERCFLPRWGATMGNFHSDIEALAATFGNLINVGADTISRNMFRLDGHDSAELMGLETCRM